MDKRTVSFNSYSSTYTPVLKLLPLTLTLNPTLSLTINLGFNLGAGELMDTSHLMRVKTSGNRVLNIEVSNCSLGAVTGDILSSANIPKY